jgi:hypothetical protein
VFCHEKETFLVSPMWIPHINKLADCFNVLQLPRSAKPDSPAAENVDPRQFKARFFERKEGMYLPSKASAVRIREAEKARDNRLEVIKALLHGTATRREMVKWGIFTSAGVLSLKNGLNPFVGNAWSGNIPTGLPSSPLFGVQPFTTPTPRFDVLARQSLSALTPAPTAQANTAQQVLNTNFPGVQASDTGPIEGRPPGPIWAHQDFDTRAPQVAYEATQEGAKTNTVYNPAVASHQRQGRAVHSNAAARMGIRLCAPQLRRARQRTSALDGPLQLQPPSLGN